MVDIGGSEVSRLLSIAHYKDSNGFLIVLRSDYQDIEERSTLQRLKDYLREIHSEIKSQPVINILLIANTNTVDE